MDWLYTYNPFIWPPFLTSIFLASLSVYSWRWRSVPGALLFSIGSLLGTFWMLGALMEFSAVSVATKIFWFKAQVFFQLPATTAITCFILEYTWPGRWLIRRNLVLFSIVPLLCQWLILTNDHHHLIWLGFSYDGSLTPLLGWGAWFFFAYVYGLGFLEIFVYAWLFRHSSQHRWPVFVMLSGQIAARVVYALEIANMASHNTQLQVFAIDFLFFTYAVALFGFRIFDPIIFARQTVIEQICEGMLVLDSQGLVVSLNQAAQQMLGVSVRSAIGRPIKELIPAYSNSDSVERTVVELCLPELGVLEGGRESDDAGEALPVRDFTLATSKMKDWRGMDIGRLLLLRDVTEPKRARELQKQQQLLLAIMQERERLAREMHDSLGQTLASAHLQTGTARLLFSQGKTASADKCLKQVMDMTIAAEADVREYLLGAKTVLSDDQHFFPALKQYVRLFSQQYDVQVRLSIPPYLEQQGLGPLVEAQLMRIIQEALSNVRKHAHAKSAQVVFTVSELLVQVAIIDDGQGFDSADVLARQVEGFGLQVMRERAESLGGCLEIISQPGLGTQVLVQIQIDGVPTEKEMVA